MAHEELLRTGRIRRETVTPGEIREAMKLAARDLRLARKILQEDADWGFAVAYNGHRRGRSSDISDTANRAETRSGPRTLQHSIASESSFRICGA